MFLFSRRLFQLDETRGVQLNERVSMYQVQVEADNNDWSEEEKGGKKIWMTDLCTHQNSYYG